MKKSLLQQLKNCFMDLMAPTITYVIGVFLVLAFYSVSVKERVEFVYPLTLAIVVYVIYVLIEFLRYLSFHRSLEAMADYQDVEVKTYTNAQLEVREKIGQIHGRYSRELHEQEMKSQKEVRFLSTWIHNMKTPVSVSNLILQRYELNQVTDEAMVKGLKEENEKLNLQLDMVLNMLRMNEFVKDYMPSQVNLTTSLMQLINQQQKQFIYNRVFPKVEKPKEDLMVLSDTKWNNLVIGQLINNAIKYSRPKEEEASSTIEFDLRQYKDKVELSITDHGKGIPDYDLNRVFEPFFTGENGRSTKGASGIGLYFCKEVCDMLGHELVITSKVGVGTVATITYLAKL